MGLHGYIDKQLQHTNEKVLYRAHISWVPLITGAVPTMAIASTLGGAAWGLTANMALGLGVIGVGGVIAVLTRIPKIVYNLGVDICVTDKRLHTKTGIININNDHETQLSRINDTIVDPSIVGRVLDYANVTIQTVAGEDDFTFRHVANPYGLRDALSNAREIAQTQSQGSGRVLRTHRTSEEAKAMRAKKNRNGRK